MGTYDYKPLKDTATRLIKKYGVSFSAEREGSTFKSSGVFGDLDIISLPNTLQQSADSIIFIEADSKYKPKNGDYLTFGDDVFVILRTRKVKPGDTEMLYEVVLGN